MSTQLFAGYAGLLLAWFSAVGLIYINYSRLQAGQLMACRSAVAALVLALLLKGDIWGGWPMVWAGVTLGFMSYCVFKSTASFGTPTMALSVLTLTPFLTTLMALILGEAIPSRVIPALILVITGLLLLLQPWCWKRVVGRQPLAGLLWGISAAIAYAIFCRLAHGAHLHGLHQYIQAALWQSIGAFAIAVLAGSRSLPKGWRMLRQSRRLQAEVLCFALVAGVCFFLGNSMTLSNLPTVNASLLLQMESLVVAVVGRACLRRRLTPGQWSGILLTLLGAWLSH